MWTVEEVIDMAEENSVGNSSEVQNDHSRGEILAPLKSVARLQEA